MRDGLRVMMAAAASMGGGCTGAASAPPSAASQAGAVTLPTALAEAVRADGAKRAGVAPDSLRIHAEAVTWRDGSLGCPQADRLYTQALVPGWRIAVEVGTQTLAYHASQRGAWRFCPPGQAQDPIADDARR